MQTHIPHCLKKDQFTDQSGCHRQLGSCPVCRGDLDCTDGDWNSEVVRSATQAVYWHTYRYAPGERGTVLAMALDILADSFIDEGPFSLEKTEPSEWLRRYMDHYRDGKTGRSVNTIPRPDRYKAVRAFIESSGFLTPAALLDHTEPAYAATLVASSEGYDRFADQTLLDGTFRGAFMGTALTRTGLSQCVLLCHLLKGEEYFRVRLFETVYQRRGGEDETALFQRAENLEWDTWSKRDGFSALGTMHGALFLLRGKGSSAAGCDVSDFAFDKKGRRILALTATPDNDQGPPVRFNLCQRPRDIERSLSILRLISRELDCPLAAE